MKITPHYLAGLIQGFVETREDLPQKEADHLKQAARVLTRIGNRDASKKTS